MNFRIFLNRRKPRAALLHFCLAAGLTLCQNQCFASSTASESKLEQPTQATDARATDPETEFAPGPLLERRKRLKRCIELAKGYGINVTVGYEVHFDVIERKVNRGASEAEILSLIEKLESRLNDQLNFDILTLYDNKPGAKTAYVKSVAEFIAPTLDKITEPVKGESILITVDKSGKFKSIEPCGSSGTTTESISRLKSMIQLLEKFPPAPEENMVLLVSVGDLPVKRLVSLYDLPSLSNFMKSIEQRIKSRWNPTNDSQSTKITTMFTVSRDGSIKDIKLTIPSANKNHNKAAIRALNKSSPIPLLPDGFYMDRITKFTFTFNAKENSSD